MVAEPTRLRGTLALAGFMGTGKSTIGPLVAERLGRGFVDLDQLVEQREGRSVAELFDRAGEQGFRLAEQRALAATLSGPPTVLALGGGTVHQPACAALLAHHTVVVLTAPWPVILVRISESDRPLAPQAEELFAARAAGYAAAGPVVQSGDAEPAVIAGRVLRILAVA